jgi:hypothetical protein
MTRYWEAYLENTGFKPDWYRRVSLRIHLWSPDTNIWDWINNTPFKDQSDLALKNYHASLSPDNKLLMRSIGAHYLYGIEPAPIVVEKNIEILDEGLITSYKLTNHGGREVHVRIGLEYHVAPKIDRIGKGMPMGYYVGGEFHDINESWTGGENKIIVKSPEYPDIILESSGT